MFPLRDIRPRHCVFQGNVKFLGSSAKGIPISSECHTVFLPSIVKKVSNSQEMFPLQHFRPHH
ncbi:unnamed protein product, partial [Nesidiocoris tenuis]